MEPSGLRRMRLSRLRNDSAGVRFLTADSAAERLSCVKSNVTQLANRLKADGLVARTAGLGDRRSRLAVLTEAGRRAFDQGARLREEAERELFGVLSAEETAQLARIIEKLERRTA